MYSYQHRYHAGNFADLHKHLVILGILNTLIQKETAFAVLDAYAGEGLYHLHCQESQKNKEFVEGIDRVRNQNAPPLITDLLAIRAQYQAQYTDPIYPGSPLLIQARLRPKDRAMMVENHPQAYACLRHYFQGNRQCHVYQRDALEVLNAALPFPEKRGLIVMDPSYELKQEYDTVAQAVIKAYGKFKNGIYAIWYPLLPEQRHLQLLQQFKESGIESIEYTEWIPDTTQPFQGLYGSGMLLVNPPWKLNESLRTCFDFLKATSFPQSKVVSFE